MTQHSGFFSNGFESTFVCTGNAGKLAEFRSVLGGSAVGVRELETDSGLTYAEPAEDASLFLANGLTKLFSALAFVEACARVLGQDPSSIANRVLVDDSGLCVPALGFAPGVHSATFGGLPRSDARNRAALSERLRSLGLERTPAFFVCYLLSVEVEAALLAPALRSPQQIGDEPLLARIEREVHMPLAARAHAEGRSCGALVERHAIAELVCSLSHRTLVDVAFGYCTGWVSCTEQHLIPGEGHGYDAQFYPLDSPALSFASVTLEEKNRVSHRAQALAALLELGSRASTLG